MIAFQLKRNGKVIHQNFDYGNCDCSFCPLNKTEIVFCQKHNEDRRRGLFTKKEYQLYLCTNDDIKSSKVFKSKASILMEFAPYMLQVKENLAHSNKRIIDRLTHNLKKYSAHCIQASENILDPFASTSGTKNQYETIRRTISSSSDTVVRSLLKIVKNSKLIQAELSVYDRLNKKGMNKLNERTHHSIHRLLRSVLSAFWESFNESNIRIELKETYDEVYVDYETFTVALVHIIDNCTKYACPHNPIQISFDRVSKSQLKIAFKMLSLRVMPDEIKKLFALGYSGELAKELELNGTGTGMFIVKKFIEMNGGHVDFKVHNGNVVNLNGIEYTENTIEVVVPTD